MKRAFSQLSDHIKRLISERKAELAPSPETTIEKPKPEARYDLFNNLIQASVQDKEGGGLSDEELAGNIFVFLLCAYTPSSDYKETLTIPHSFLQRRS